MSPTVRLLLDLAASTGSSRAAPTGAMAQATRPPRRSHTRNTVRPPPRPATLRLSLLKEKRRVIKQ